MTYALSGKVCLVTGAAGVVGAAISRRFAAMGCRVILVDIAAERIAALAAELGASARPLAMDIAVEPAVLGGLASLEADWRGIDILGNNAGILPNNEAVAPPAEEWRRVLAVNLDGAFYLAKACLPHMRLRRWGRIVNICSLAMK